MNKKIIITILCILLLISFVNATPDGGYIYYNCNDNILDQWGSNDASSSGGFSYSVDYPTFNKSDDGSTKACILDGTNGKYYDLTINLNANLNYSISMWMKHHTTVQEYFFGLKDTDDDDYMSLQVQADGDIFLRFRANSVYTTKDFTVADVVQNVYTNIVFVYDADNTNCYMYQDGNYLGELDSCPATTGTHERVNIGTDGSDSSFFDGATDEIKIYTKALNTTEINNLYNYGNITGESTPSINYFDITAKDEYDSSSLTNFSAKVNGTTYYTTNGTIETNILRTSSDLIEVIMGSDEGGGYFNKTYTSQAVTNNKEYTIFQAEVNFQGLRKILNTSIIGNFTINGTIHNTTEQRIKAGTYEVTFNSSGWFDKSQNITITALYNGTKNITRIYDTLLNITVLNAYTSNPLENFTGWVYDTITGYNESYNVSTYEGFIELIKERNYTLYATNPSYAIDSSLNYKNETWNNTLYNISFLLYTNNSLRIKIYDENSGSLITENITIVLTGNESETTYTTTNGNKFIEGLQDGNYTVKFSGGNYTLKTYSITVAERSTQKLNAYLSSSEETVIFTIRDSDSYTVIEGASITMYRLINASWVVVEAKNSDITGRAQFTYNIGIQYKFFVSFAGYDDKVFYLDPIIFSSYNINLDKEVTLTEDQDYLGVNIQYYPKEFYANQTNNFTWLIQSPSGTLESYHFNITYPNGSNYQSGTNSIGEEFTHSFNISTTTISDTINLTYCYKSSIGTQERCYSFIYSIIGVYGEGSFTAVKDNTYGLSLITRILTATLIVLVVAGILSFMGNALIGAIIGLLLLGFFARIEFIPLWSTLLSLFLGVIFIIWRSE